MCNGSLVVYSARAISRVATHVVCSGAVSEHILPSGSYTHVNTNDTVMLILLDVNEGE